MAILRGLPRVAGPEYCVFTVDGCTPCPGFGKAKARRGATMAETLGGAPPPWVLHDLRRVLDHVPGPSRVVDIRQRRAFQPENRSALDAWARHVEASQG